MKLGYIKIAAQIVLAGVIVWLGYLCYDSIRVPQEFKMIKERRYEAIIERLKDIRSAQEAYKQTYNVYAPNFDSLINFIKYDSVKSVKSIGELTDEQITYLCESFRRLSLIYLCLFPDTLACLEGLKKAGKNFLPEFLIFY